MSEEKGRYVVDEEYDSGANNALLASPEAGPDESPLWQQVIFGPTGNGTKGEKTGHTMAAMLASGEQCRINNSTD